jgi:hypothetical protein
MTLALAALMALLNGRSTLRRTRRFLACLSALARSPLRCDIKDFLFTCGYNQVELEARFDKERQQSSLDRKLDGQKQNC